MKFAHNYSGVKAVPEKNTGRSITEKAGYIPPRVQIEQFILAGKRLNQSREEMYDDFSEFSEEDHPTNPLRALGIDMAEVSEIQHSVAAKLRKQEALAKQRELDKIEADKLQLETVKKIAEKKAATQLED